MCEHGFIGSCAVCDGCGQMPGACRDPECDHEECEFLCDACHEDSRTRADRQVADQQARWAADFTREIEDRYGSVNEDSIRQYWLERSAHFVR